MDARSCSPMDGTDRQTCQQRDSPACHSRQGCLKSTFCKSLMPDSLSRYYSDEIELTSRSNVTRKMSEMGLLNLDEFDKYSAKQMPLLKA